MNVNSNNHNNSHNHNNSQNQCRQRDRATERQRDRETTETERHKGRQTDRQTDCCMIAERDRGKCFGAGSRQPVELLAKERDAAPDSGKARSPFSAQGGRRRVGDSVIKQIKLE